MSAERFNDDLRELVPGMRIRQAVTAARLNALTALARDASRGSMIRGGPGLRVSSGPQGVTVRARKPLPRAGGGGSTAKPLQVKTDGTVVYGTICGEIPTIGGTLINDATPPAMTFPGTGQRYARVTITGTLAVTDGIFVRPVFSSITSVVISLETTASTSAGLSGSSGVYTFDLASILNGVPSQNGFGPIGYELCDDLSGGAVAQIQLSYTS
jgi:hypothetical protein